MPNSGAEATSTETGFLEGARGPLFHILHVPATAPYRGCILYIHPFGEELNKSRRMSALLGRHLAAAGYVLMLPDLYGCGDSGGDFHQARWEIWLEDLGRCLDTLESRFGGPLTLLGLRAGCLLASDLLKTRLEPVAGTVFWQPITNGDLALTQFLRLRMAAGMMGGARENTTDLRARLDAGEILEVAGYPLAPELAKSLARVRLAAPATGAAHWIELVQGQNTSLSPGSTRLIEAWRSEGCEVSASVVRGDPFWNTHDITEVPKLLEQTLRCIETHSGGQVTQGSINRPVTQSEHGPTSDHTLAETQTQERAVRFQVGDAALLGILHAGNPEAAHGVLVLVGGPQYRVGSHRQFLLLARRLAGAGIPVLRFDYRGMGDSEGTARNFEGVGADILAAVDCLHAQVPSLRSVTLWGLCDGASAALIHAWQDPRVSGLILLNPWVRTQEGLAKAYLKRYYLRRLLSLDFWEGLLRGRVNPVASLGSLLSMVIRVIGTKRGTDTERIIGTDPRTGTKQDTGTERSAAAPHSPAQSRAPGLLPERMADGWKRFKGPIQLILSGDDLTAAEFRDTAGTNPAWRGLLEEPRLTVHELPEANHTFSRSEWRVQVEDWNLEWLQAPPQKPAP